MRKAVLLVVVAVLGGCVRGEAGTTSAAVRQALAVKPDVPTDVTTWHNDVLRSGANLTESVLTPATVKAGSFGRLRSLPVDGKVDAQPLYLSGYDFHGAWHNALFVATEHDTVYAFDTVGFFSSPAYFDSRLYYAANNDHLKAFIFDHARLQSRAGSRSDVEFDRPGATPSVSANGAHDGIVWVVQNADGDAVLRAYDATDVSRQVWSSDQAAHGGDAVGSDNKFIVPTIADGRVFVGTTDSVVEFGLLAQH